jgi:3-methyl-2-oxobutanoate hydroxymethyltransferase
MPFGSYQVSDEDALENAIRLVKEGGADAVKLEGAGRTLSRIVSLVEAGIPVMGHIGLTPQSATMLGGYRAQGRTAEAGLRLVDEAVALERAGCFAIVLEAMPAAVADRVTAAVRIPTIGIGAGAGCSGQVLVWHDLLGLSPDPMPRFVKRYAALADTISTALRTYVQEVREGRFPDARHTYGMPEAERERFAAEPATPRK